MRVIYGIFFLVVAAVVLLVYPFNIAGEIGVGFSAGLISMFNFAAFVTALVCYIQFLFPMHHDDGERGEYNRVPFQFFNMIFVVLYFTISINFLIANKTFYPGYEKLANDACVKKYYLSNGINSVIEIFIASSVVVNILYILTHLPDFYGRYRDTSKKKRRQDLSEYKQAQSETM